MSKFRNDPFVTQAPISLALGLALACLVFISTAQAQRGRRIEVLIGESTVISAAGVERFFAPEDGPIEVDTSPNGREFVITARAPGESELVLFYPGGREVRYEITVPEPTGGGAVGPVSERENIRLDLYFIELTETYGHQIGLGFPGSIGGPGVGTTSMTLDFVGNAMTPGPRFSGATLQLLNQALPRLDLMQSSGWARLRRQAMLVTANGTPAQLQAGGEINIRVAGALTAEIRTIEYGSEIRMTPRYDPTSGRIELQIQADLSELTERENPENPPGRRTTVLRSLVNMQPGQAIVLGGLNTRAESESQGGLPGLSQIPFLGVLFGTNQRRGESRQSFLFVVPTIVQAVGRSERNYIEEALETYQRFSGFIQEYELIEREPPGYGGGSSRSTSPSTP